MSPMTSPIGLETAIWKPGDLNVAILNNWSHKWPYLDDRVELTRVLAASLVNTVHLQSMINYDHANANANFHNSLHGSITWRQWLLSVG